MRHVDPITCSAPGCSAITRHAKPYCEAHVELNPYVVALRRRMADEVARDRLRLRTIPPYGGIHGAAHRSREGG